MALVDDYIEKKTLTAESMQKERTGMHICVPSPLNPYLFVLTRCNCCTPVLAARLQAKMLILGRGINISILSKLRRAGQQF